MVAANFESRQRFEPKQMLEIIRAGGKDERSADIEKWKARYLKQREALAAAQVSLIRALRKRPDMPEAEIVAIFKDLAAKRGFSEKQERLGLEAIKILELRRLAMRSAREKYPNDRELFKAIFGFSPIGPVRLRQMPANLEFQITNKVDIVRACNFDVHGIHALYQFLVEYLGSHSEGAIFTNLHLADLNNGVTVVRQRAKRPEVGDASVHEEQHVFFRILRAAARRVETPVDKDIDPDKKLMQEYIEDLESSFAEEILSLYKGLARSPLHKIRFYFNELISIQIKFLKRNEAHYLKNGYTRADLEKVVATLESDAFRARLWKTIVNASFAYNELRNRGRFSHEEIAALLDLEPLSRWSKLAKRIIQ